MPTLRSNRLWRWPPRNTSGCWSSLAPTGVMTAMFSTWHFIDPTWKPCSSKNYEVVHVDVGEGDKNQDLMEQYQVPMKKGIPAIAVLDSDGKLLYSQRGGEFEKARALAPEDVLAFLNQWKPAVH